MKQAQDMFQKKYLEGSSPPVAIHTTAHGCSSSLSLPLEVEVALQ